MKAAKKSQEIISQEKKKSHIFLGKMRLSLKHFHKTDFSFMHLHIEYTHYPEVFAISGPFLHGCKHPLFQ